MDALKKPIRAPSIKRGEKIIIDANAGSGKTTALIGVMAVAIRQWGLRVKCLLAVTFSKAMAGELTGSLKWTPCLGQFCPEFKLVRLLQSQRFGAAPS